MKKIWLLLPALAMITPLMYAQLVATPSNNPTALVNSFIQSGVTVSNVQYIGDTNAMGSFSAGNNTNLGIKTGIVLTTGNLTAPPLLGSPAWKFSSSSNNTAGDSLLNTLVPGSITYDASVLIFDLIPAGNILQFEYVFASEEYPEYVNSPFNDVFGFFISGPNPAGGSYLNTNVAILPGTNLPVSINTVNAFTNQAFYVDNSYNTTVVFDGFTTVLTATIPVLPLALYRLKMAIADVGDSIYDSGVFLQCPSMRSYTITGIEDRKPIEGLVYPNPFTQSSSLHLDLTQAGKVVVSIYDFSGRYLEEETFQCLPGSNTFPIGDFLRDYSSGFYFIGIQTPEGSFIEKLMK